MESKRRRVDTLGDIYARPAAPVEQPAIDPRRVSCAVDPAMNGYGSPRPSHHAAAHHHHRPSSSYPPPSHASVPYDAHGRHQSSPIPPNHVAYPHQPSHQSMVAQGPYPQPIAHHGAVYEQRPSYYQEHQAPVYGYDRPHEAYYARPSYSGPAHPSYDNAYGDIRFQQHVGLDHNAFNRKRRGNLPKEATNLLKDWFAANRSSPYPTEDQKIELCTRTGLSLNQVRVIDMTA